MSGSDGGSIVIVSGGIDSTTLLYKAKADGCDVRALTFLYGQKHSREVHSAEAVCRAVGVDHRLLDLSAVAPTMSGSALTDPNVPVPEVPAEAEHYSTLRATVVPNRNAVFLSIAVAYAVSVGARAVLFGAHHSDRGVYPDCRREFVLAFERAERLAIDDEGFRVEAPFVDMDKADIVKLGVELGVPFELTWSCYRGGELHCGVCSSCRERKRAFLEAGVTDPTRYER